MADKKIATESDVLEAPIVKSKMAISQESIKFVEPGVDAIMDVTKDPTLNAIIERTGGDDFLKNAQPIAPPAPVVPPITLGTTDPNGFGSGNYNANPAPPPVAGPKSFTIQDPEAALIEKRKVMQQQATQQIHKEISKESGNMMADMLVDGFGMVAPELAEIYYKLPEGKLKILEQTNKVPEGTLEQVKKWNREHKGQIKFTKAMRDLVHPPLVKVLEIQNVKADPTSMLILALIMVCFMMFMQAKSLKAEGNEMVENLITAYEKSQRRMREEMEAVKAKKDEVPTVDAEEVTIVRNPDYQR